MRKKKVEATKNVKVVVISANIFLVILKVNFNFKKLVNWKLETTK